MQRPSQAVILAAGASTRTHPLTVDRPKPLLPLLNRPLLTHLLDQLDGLVAEVVLVVGFEQEQIRESVGDRYGTLAITYREQLSARGTGDALQKAQSAIKEPFFLLNGDDLIHRNDLERLAATRNGVLGALVPDPSRFGVLKVDDAGNVIRIVEKPQAYTGRPLVSTGAFVFQPSVFEALDAVGVSSRGELEVVEVINYLPVGERCRVVEAQEAWLPIGYPWKLLEANLFLLSRSQPSPPHVPGVEIRPPVLIGTGSHIEAGCSLGPGVTVGQGCRIMGRSAIANSLIMDGVTIGPGCTIEETIIGTGAIVEKDVETRIELPDGGRVYSTVRGQPVDTERARLGATIGHHVRLGAASRTLPGVKIWPGIIVEPGEVVQADLFKV
jgi:bifunctional UDP-N-acetylglucosamine pyrophosphorylase/glucosamine-1-phosphate N-acetyltransferase